MKIIPSRLFLPHARVTCGQVSTSDMMRATICWSYGMTTKKATIRTPANAMNPTLLHPHPSPAQALPPSPAKPAAIHAMALGAWKKIAPFAAVMGIRIALSAAARAITAAKAATAMGTKHALDAMAAARMARNAAQSAAARERSDAAPAAAAS